MFDCSIQVFSRFYRENNIPTRQNHLTPSHLADLSLVHSEVCQLTKFAGFKFEGESDERFACISSGREHYLCFISSVTAGTSLAINQNKKNTVSGTNRIKHRNFYTQPSRNRVFRVMLFRDLVFRSQKLCYSSDQNCTKLLLPNRKH